jgi:membrane associated rhomboid family serine protease
MTFIVLLVIGGYAVYVMSPDERLKLARRAEGLARHGAETLAERHRTPEPFRDALRARTPWALVTGAVVFLSVTVYLLVSLGGGTSGDPEALIAWGASFGPRTTNGEWWRLATSLLVHAGFLHLLINVAGLVQVGIITERLVGHLAFGVVYVAAGLFASLETLSAQPLAVAAGASGAIFGIYGLFIATLLWNLRRQSSGAPLQLGNLRESLGLRITPPEPLGPSDPREPAEPSEPGEPSGMPPIPLKSLAMLAPAMTIFLLYSATDGIQTSELAGLVAGFASGLVLGRGASQARTPVFQTAAVAAVAVVVVIASAAMLSGVADVRPEIARVLALEDRTAIEYEKAVSQFKNGGLSAQALAKVINQSIVPELQAARARLQAVNGVPPEHQPLVANAVEYFRLRDESWRLRADALRKSNMRALQAADRSERASLEALDKIRTADAK